MKSSQAQKPIPITKKCQKGFAHKPPNPTRQSAEDLKKEGLKIFPMGLLNEYSEFSETLGGAWEYPDEDTIYREYSDRIKQFAQSLPHSTKCDFWEFLMFVRINKDCFKQYIEQTIRKTKLSKDSCLIYLWKRLSIASSESQYFQVVNGEFDDELNKYESWEEEYSLSS